ncbi:hypothetical protein ERO13_A05G084500v2 [Gossypium hirsutum]|uniref:Uncharacterized protein n=3 Tax=Gossypium TaxID=3633 RepID=A0A5J5VLT2_GOSBA|nr:hypothetical protein ES319_A05G088600v1 [Gossypium barbadense]KAG4198431.1 hypothetical protein ERO13_A05G084500v2 [Gossypium hirsutum]TYH16087.1 hypothetical protein ES288_A05G090700v1 [Gossypium darwinii]TYJ33249.1 hypothetical protein E1A91_A05G090000v1 [Gossypium mustelinum]
MQFQKDKKETRGYKFQKFSRPNHLSLAIRSTFTSMSKDHHETILQESLQKLEEQQQKERLEKDVVKEGGLAWREGIEEEEKEECKTPTSSDHKIPTIQSCPPTPKKKVRVSMVHKRKLSELHFFETTRREEVESFFRSNSHPLTVDASPDIKRRRCRSA